MALLFCDGADHYTSGATALSKWSGGTSNGGPSGSAGAGRFGGGAIAYSGGSNSGYLYKNFAAAQTIVAGWAHTRPAPQGGVWDSILIGSLGDGSVVHIQLQTDSSSRPCMFRGGTQVGPTATDALTAGWHYFEMKVKVDDTVGTLELRVDGVVAIGPLTNVDTRNAGTALISQFRLGPVSTSPFGPYLFDDVYICDTTGSIANDFLGDVRVQCIYPTGNGNSSQLLGSDSNTTDNYLLVDESVPNDDTDYVESSTVGQKDTYAYGNISAITGTVHAVQPVIWARKTDAGARTIASVARVSGTEEDSAAKALGLSYGLIQDIRHTKPGGGAWTIADVNNAEFGVKILS